MKKIAIILTLIIISSSVFAQEEQTTVGEPIETGEAQLGCNSLPFIDLYGNSDSLISDDYNSYACANYCGTNCDYVISVKKINLRANTYTNENYDVTCSCKKRESPPVDEETAPKDTQNEEKSLWGRLWDWLLSSKDVSQQPPVKVLAPNELAYLEIKESACGKTELSPEDVVLASYLPGGPKKPAGFDFPSIPPKAVEEVEQFLASCAQLGPNPNDEEKEINRPEVKENLIARCKETANNPTLANAKDIQDWLDQQSSDAIIVKSEDDDLEPQEHAGGKSSLATRGNIWPPYNDPDSNWPWNKFIPQSQNPCKEISNEKVVVTSDSVKIRDKEYTPEQVELTILRPGFLAAKVELPGKPGGPSQYPTGPSLKARNDRPIYIPPRGIIKRVWYGSDIPQEVIDTYGLASRPWYGPDYDSAIQPKAKQDTNLDESILAGYLPGGPKKPAGMDLPGKPPKATEDQSQQVASTLAHTGRGSNIIVHEAPATWSRIIPNDDKEELASVIPGRETVQPPLAARHGREGWLLEDEDILAIVIPGGPHTNEPQRLCTKNVELNIKPGVPPSIPPYPGSPPISPRSQKYEEINPQDFIKLQISRNACDKGKTVAEGIISIPKEEVKLAMINVPGMSRPITAEKPTVIFPPYPKPTIVFPKTQQAVPAQLPPAPKLPEMPTTDTELDDKDCCIKCQPVFQARTVNINDQCPEGFYKRIFEGCDKHEVKYLQSFCPKKEQTKQISTKNPVPTMPPTVPERPKLS